MTVRLNARVIADEMAMRIVAHLRFGPVGFNALDRAVNAPNPMRFSRIVKKLMRDGIIDRRVITLGPPAKTEYSLTSLGRDLSEPASLMVKWIDRNAGEIEAARAMNRARAAANELPPSP